MSELDLQPAPRRLYACTPARLLAWLDCPRRYRMTYVDRPPPRRGPPWAHHTLGIVVHNALAAWWRLARPERSVARAGALVDASWRDDGFRDAEQAGTWRARAREMVERYTEELDPAAEPLGVERTVAMKTARLTVSGRVDRVDDRGAEAVVVDYKTGRWVPTADDARGSIALALYAAATERTLRRPTRRVELHHLPSGRVVEWRHTDETLRRHLGRAEDIAAEAGAADARAAAGLEPDEADQVFPARPGAQCAWCDFAAHCPPGQAARPTALPWAGLAEDREPVVAVDG